MSLKNEEALALGKSRTKLSWWHRQLIAICKQGGVPEHIALIMDGNRRFARMKHLTSVVIGHEKGFESLLYSLEICLELGVKVVTVYAFSEENFSRPKEEVDGLMQMAVEKFKDFLDVESLVMQKGVIVDMLGRSEILPPQVRAAAARVILGTKDNPGRAKLNICFAYSGAEEIASAMRSIAKGLLVGKLTISDITTNLISRCTYLRDACPPDLLIRTSGETRLSDFLLWHLRNTKLCFIDVLWPDISLYHLLSCIIDWQISNRSSKPVSGKVLEQFNERVQRFIDEFEAERLKKWREAENADSETTKDTENSY